MDFYKTYMLPITICMMFLAESLLAGVVFTKPWQKHDPKISEDVLLTMEAKPDTEDNLLRHLFWEAGFEIPPTSPLAAARNIEYTTITLHHVIDTVVNGQASTHPPTQDPDTIFDNLFFNEMMQPSWNECKEEVPPAKMLNWNEDSMACEARSCPLNFNAGEAKPSHEDAFIRTTLHNAARFMHPIEVWSRRFHLAPDLVYGIAMTESNFNATLISSRDAHGLMQIVPWTAGQEVKRWLGESGTPTRQELLDPYINIKYGTAYISFLMKQYFGAINDPASREYCTIAAYNSGATPVLAAFSPKRHKAINIINAMSSDEVLNTLLDRLPILETRFFIRKVLTAKAYFTPSARQEIRLLAAKAKQHS